MQREATARLKNYMIDSEGIPLEFECITYEGVLDVKRVKIFITEHGNSEVVDESGWFYIV